MFSFFVRTLVVTSFLCGAIASSLPAQAQEAAVEEAVEAVQPLAGTIVGSPDPAAATTTQDPTIPVDELVLLVKPLTLEELENEAAAWFLLLKAKVKEVGDTEIAIKRSNRGIQANTEAATALDEAKKALEAAQEAQKNAKEGSPEYLQATEKVKQAQDNLTKAQEALEESKKTQEQLAEDSTVQERVEQAEANQEILKEVEQAKEWLGLLKQSQQQVQDKKSEAYLKTEKDIQGLETAIADVEKALEAQRTTSSDDPEAVADIEQKVTQARETLKQAMKAVEGSLPSSAAPQSNGSLSVAEAAATEDATGQQPTTATGEDTEQEAEAEVDRAVTELSETAPGDAADAVADEAAVTEKTEQLEETKNALEEKAAEDAEVKNQLVGIVTQLQTERTALIDRFNVILDEIDAKGGDSTPYRKYITAVSILEIDLEDTSGLGVRLLGWLKSEEGGMRWGWNLLRFLTISISISIVAYIVSLIVGRALEALDRAMGDEMSDILRDFIVLTIRRLGVLIGVVVGLTAFGVSLGPLLALVGGISFVLAFALQSSLGNFASGMMMMVYKPLDVGDEVRINGDVWGFVDSITLANTKILGFDDREWILPNNTVWSAQIENFTNQKIRSGGPYIRVPFHQDISHVRSLLMELCAAHPKVLDNPKPSTFVWEVGEYFIGLIWKFSTKTEDFWGAWDDLLVTMQKRFAEEGIAVAYPTSVEIDYEHVISSNTLSDADPKDPNRMRQRMRAAVEGTTSGQLVGRISQEEGTAVTAETSPVVVPTASTANESAQLNSENT